MKKLVLLGLAVLIALAIMSLSSSSALAFFGFGEGGGGSSLNCDEILKKITKDSKVVAEWGTDPVGGFKYITDKKILNKQDQDHCYLYRGQAEDDIKGQYNSEEEIKILYFTDSNLAIAKLQELKRGERDDFKMKNSDELSYSGHTESRGEAFFEENGEPKQYTVDVPNYARTVRALGNCLTEVKYFDHMDRHGWSFKTRENFIWQVAEWYNGTTEGFDKAISTSEDILTFCGAKAPSNSSTNQIATPNNGQSSKPNALDKTSRGFPVFIGEWFRAVSGGILLHDWLIDTASIIVNGQDTQEIAQTEQSIKYINSLSDDYVYHVTGSSKDQLEERIERDPGVTDDIVNQFKQKAQDTPFRLDILEGQAQIRYPGENKWKDIKVGDQIPAGSTIFTGMDTTTVLSIRDKGVVQILSFTEVTISEEGLSQPGKTTTDIDLRTGEIELNVEGGAYTGSLQVITPTATNAVRGTHFWVSYDKDKGLSAVGVYKGEVEVRARGSEKSTFVSPNGGRPGVVVVAQKPSALKLISVGAILLIIVGGLFLFLKKGEKNSRPKKVR